VLNEFGVLGEAMDVARRKEMHGGAYFLAWIQRKLSAQGLTHFGELMDADASDERRRSFGVQLVAPLTKAPAGRAQGAAAPPLPSFIEYLKSLADTATQAHDRFYLEDEDFARTIAISTLGVRTTEFEISPDRAAALIQSGREATDKFLVTWDFDAWVEAYRSSDWAPASPQSQAAPT
jgi:hypothetical protein